jgi:hypothetical protein
VSEHEFVLIKEDINEVCKFAEDNLTQNEEVSASLKV